MNINTLYAKSLFIYVLSSKNKPTKNDLLLKNKNISYVANYRSEAPKYTHVNISVDKKKLDVIYLYSPLQMTHKAELLGLLSECCHTTDLFSQFLFIIILHLIHPHTHSVIAKANGKQSKEKLVLGCTKTRRFPRNCLVG